MHYWNRLKQVANLFVLCEVARTLDVVYAGKSIRDLGAESWTVTNEHKNITVPGKFESHVHLDLFAAGAITDPYYGTNEIDLRWIAAQNWTYTSKPIKQLSKKKAINTWLVFDGLDTYTTIKFCDKIVGTTDNQFRQWHFDVSSVLQHCTSSPVLSINFGSVPRIAAAINATGVESWPSSIIEAFTFEYTNRQFVRKEQSDFGWDWGPAFVPSGPWRAGRIVQLSDNGDLYPLNTNIDIYRKGQTNNITPDQTQPWVVNASVDYLGTLPKKATLKATIVDAEDASQVLYSGLLKNITRMGKSITGSIVVDGCKPKLWWPREMGDQSLYKITVSVHADTHRQPVLESQRRVGFRTILLDVGNVTESQITRGYQPGNNWHFEINGHEFYVKGANIIPPDAFWPRVTQDNITRLFDAAEAHHFNMLRVWSSGVYLPDFIYDMADERGLLLWSEFEFSDIVYPAYPDFIESVTAEANYNVRRVNHHPSVACWIGGNEFENLILPSTKEADPERYPFYLGQYEHLFITTLFTALAENSRSISYTPSSANNGWTKIDFSLPVPMVERYDNTTEGELYSDTDYYNYDSSVAFDYSKYPVGRFAAEFGYHSMPSLQSWQQALDEEDLHFNSSVIVKRNHHYPPGSLNPENYDKSLEGMGQMTVAVQNYYPMPDKANPVANFSSWCHATQLFQADFYKAQIQYYRRGSGQPERQLGSLYWQFNDIWQTPSWAGIEYDGRWKVLPYVAKEVYRNVIVSPFYNSTTGELDLYVTSDLWESVRGTVDLKWVDLDGHAIKNNAGMPCSIDFRVGAINSTRVYKTNLLRDVKLPDPSNAILLLKLTTKAHLPNSKKEVDFTHENHFLPVWPKDAKFRDPGLKLSYDKSSGTFDVTATKAVSLYTWLTHPQGTVGFFSENAFVLLPGHKKRLSFHQHGQAADEAWADKVTVDSLWDLSTN